MVIFGNNRTTLGSMMESGESTDIVMDEAYSHSYGLDQIIAEMAEDSHEIFNSLIESDFAEAGAMKGVLTESDAAIIMEAEGDNVLKKFWNWLTELAKKIAAAFTNLVNNVKLTLCTNAKKAWQKYGKAFMANKAVEERGSIKINVRIPNTDHSASEAITKFGEEAKKLGSVVEDVKSGKEVKSLSEYDIIKNVTGLSAAENIGDLSKKYKARFLSAETTELTLINSANKKLVETILTSETSVDDIKKLQKAANDSINESKKAAKGLKASDTTTKESINILKKNITAYTSASTTLAKLTIAAYKERLAAALKILKAGVPSGTAPEKVEKPKKDEKPVGESTIDEGLVFESYDEELDYEVQLEMFEMESENYLEEACKGKSCNEGENPDDHDIPEDDKDAEKEE